MSKKPKRHRKVGILTSEKISRAQPRERLEKRELVLVFVHGKSIIKFEGHLRQGSRPGSLRKDPVEFGGKPMQGRKRM